MTRTHSGARRNIRLTFGAALLVSMAANVLAAEPTVVGRAVAAWPPLALMLIVDVLSLAPRSTGWLGRLTAVAAASVALVAAVASYSHMRAVALAAGESDLVAYLFPLTVDGLAVVCSAALVELNRRATAAGAEASEPRPRGERGSRVLPDFESSDDRTVRSLVMLNNSNGK